jgi:type IV pilus assembly protein PilC
VAIDIKQIGPSKKANLLPEKGNASKKILDLLNRDIKIFGKGLNDRKKEGFYAELAILLSSGIDIRTSLEIIVEEQTKPVLKEMFGKIYNLVISGLSLSEALYQTGHFTLYEYYSLKIGEESGKIRDVLADLTIYFSKKIKQRRQLTAAFTYPSLVVLTAFIAVFFMLKFIVPMFTEVFKRFQGELPPLTRFIISMSDSFAANAVIFVLIVSAILFATWVFRKKEWFRKGSTAILLKIPVLGMILNKIYLARFCQSMALLLSSRTPMLKSIQLIRNMIGFYPFEQALITIENDVLHGMLLNQSMQQFQVFDKRMLALTRIAEEVNQLDKVYTKLNSQYSEELEHQIGLIGNILEPIMIILVGLLVAIILISMYLPLFQLSTSII